MFTFYFFKDGYKKNWNDMWLASYFLRYCCSGQCVRHCRLTDVNTARVTLTGGSQGSSDLREKEEWTMRPGQRSLPCSSLILPRNCLIPICSQWPLWWWPWFIGLYTEERNSLGTILTSPGRWIVCAHRSTVTPELRRRVDMQRTPPSSGAGTKLQSNYTWIGRQLQLLGLTAQGVQEVVKEGKTL